MSVGAPPAAKMSRLLDHLRESYDVIVLDSPPVLAVVDPRILAQMADATVFLVNWGKTRRKIVITAGQAGTDASELLLSEKMSRLLDHLRESYDVIVLDSPPVLAVVDPRILAQMADATVFLVNWGKTRRKIVQAAIALLQQGDPPLLGCVLNNVDVKRMSGYGYGDAGAYYGNKKYSKYYAG